MSAILAEAAYPSMIGEGHEATAQYVADLQGFISSRWRLCRVCHEEESAPMEWGDAVPDVMPCPVMANDPGQCSRVASRRRIQKIIADHKTRLA